jgi:phosphodiesterase/alkaline phosphatase D-like protein
VTLTVYNTLGQQVATLVNESQEAGDYSVRFDGRELASGEYFYRIQADDIFVTKSLILLR